MTSALRPVARHGLDPQQRVQEHAPRRGQLLLRRRVGQVHQDHDPRRATYNNLATANGGEVISADAF